MLGDAQNIVLCKNESGKIKIYSQPLEGYMDEKSMVDYIAEITDGTQMEFSYIDMIKELYVERKIFT